MSNQRTFDPYETFKKVSIQWEQRMNDMIHLCTNNNDFIKYAKMSSDSNAGYVEWLRKSQEMLANQLNMPTKNDLANVAKLSIQTQEKLDSLEEQIWNLSDSVARTNKEMESVVEVLHEVIKMTKQLKTQQEETKEELAELKNLLAERQTTTKNNRKPVTGATK
ncbi:polyhydroxyalkanoate biosynthesis repressor PhaR [Niallia oryzisoli]|uniref:Polyhydroxyalkanoate biosynthesis repressor PhaR n=1 Tax=Niallia oryzisoli TaxID=1737571 RepID=A0ABZ2CGL5_9BACI